MLVKLSNHRSPLDFLLLLPAPYDVVFLYAFPWSFALHISYRRRIADRLDCSTEPAATSRGMSKSSLSMFPMCEFNQLTHMYVSCTTVFLSTH